MSCPDNWASADKGLGWSAAGWPTLRRILSYPGPGVILRGGPTSGRRQTSGDSPVHRLVLPALGICLAAALVLRAVAGPGSPDDDRPVEVSLIQLIADPDRFDGKLVHVCGFVRIEHEGTAVYLHRDDCEHMLTRNGFWLSANDATPAGSREADVNDRYSLIEGRFSAKERGHLGLWSGSIGQIRRMEAWGIRKGRE
jgi:hypothetical protein